MNCNFEIPITRRGFLTKIGFVLLAMEVQPLIANAQNNDQTRDRHEPEYPPYVDQAHLVINSGLGFLPHRHELLIPISVFSNPPRQGVELRTTKNYHHTHAVKLTIQEIIKIKNGEEVVVKDATVGEHTFKIYLPR